LDSLDRLYRRIADVLLREPATAVTVGDIYQHLVPYRSVRSEMGFNELAEYEHALLRLLSGERDFLVVEREEVQEEFQRELRNTNPILGVYRDYSDALVYLNPYAPELTDPDPTAPPPRLPLLNGDADAAGVVIDVTRPDPPAHPHPRPEPPARPRLRTCTGCRQPLPPGHDVRFCPFCGKALAPIPCPECSATVEPDWRFCATCGWPRDGQALPPPEQRLR
jgi:hypothetical protein